MPPSAWETHLKCQARKLPLSCSARPFARRRHYVRTSNEWSRRVTAETQPEADQGGAEIEGQGQAKGRGWGRSVASYRRPLRRTLGVFEPHADHGHPRTSG